jgi:hypothetical protein
MSSLDEIMPRHPCERCGRLHLVANGQPCLACRAVDLPATATPDDETLADVAAWVGDDPHRAGKLLDLLHCHVAGRLAWRTVPVPDR